MVSLPAQYVFLLCSLSQILIAFRCEFVAPHRITEPPSRNVNDSEAKDPLIATSLKVLEPSSSLHMLADYHMMKLSTNGNQPEQILNSDNILDDVETNKHSSSKCHINSSAHSREVTNGNVSPLCVKEQICDIENSKQDAGSSHGLSSNIVREVSGDTHGNGSSRPASKDVADGEVTQRTVPI